MSEWIALWIHPDDVQPKPVNKFHRPPSRRREMAGLAAITSAGKPHMAHFLCQPILGLLGGHHCDVFVDYTLGLVEKDVSLVILEQAFERDFCALQQV
jgi:hypothetical protein